MDVFISEDYVNRRREIKRDQRTQLLFARVEGSRRHEATPATPQKNHASASVAAAAASRMDGARADDRPCFDRLLDCFTP